MVWQHIWPQVTAKGVKNCCIPNVVDGAGGDMLWNVRGECVGGEGSDCVDTDSDSEW
jgi:hypothetical protein